MPRNNIDMPRNKASALYNNKASALYNNKASALYSHIDMTGNNKASALYWGIPTATT